MGSVCPGACLSGPVGSMLRGKERGGEARAGREDASDAVPCVDEEAGRREKVLPWASRLRAQALPLSPLPQSHISLCPDGPRAWSS